MGCGFRNLITKHAEVTVFDAPDLKLIICKNSLPKPKLDKELALGLNLGAPKLGEIDGGERPGELDLVC